jgi:hypothetical protein
MEWLVQGKIVTLGSKLDQTLSAVLPGKEGLLTIKYGEVAPASPISATRISTTASGDA